MQETVGKGVHSECTAYITIQNRTGRFDAHSRIRDVMMSRRTTMGQLYAGLNRPSPKDRLTEYMSLLLAFRHVSCRYTCIVLVTIEA